MPTKPRTEQSWLLVDHFAPKPFIAQVSSQATVRETLAVMEEKGLTSLPVYDETAQAYLGWFDMRDFARFLVSNEDTTSEMSLQALKDREIDLGGTLIRELCNLSSLNPFDPVTLGEPFAVAVEKLIAGAHRVAVVNAEGAIVNIISQSDLIRCLDAAYREGLPTEGRLSLAELQMGFKPIISVTSDATPASAFRKLATHGLSGLPIVCATTGRLVGQVSVTDLREMASQGIYEFSTSSVLPFVKPGGEKSAVVCVPPSASLGGAISAMVTHGVHRVYIVTNDDGDDDSNDGGGGGGGMAVGVISARDLLAGYDWGMLLRRAARNTLRRPASADSSWGAASGAAAAAAVAAAAPSPAPTKELRLLRPEPGTLERRVHEAYNRALLFAHPAIHFLGSAGGDAAPVVVGSSATLAGVLTAMESEGVSAVAVLAPVGARGVGAPAAANAAATAAAPARVRYAGWVDTRDVAAFFCDSRPLEKEEGEGGGLRGDETKRAVGLLETPAIEVVNRSGADAFVAVACEALALDVMALLCGGCHRVAVCDVTSGQLRRVLAQSDLSAFLHAHVHRLGSRVHASLAKLQLAPACSGSGSGSGSGVVAASSHNSGTQQQQRQQRQQHERTGTLWPAVTTIAADASPLAAYRTLLAHSLTALPVVHPRTGAVLTVLSTTDVLPLLLTGCGRGPAATATATATAAETATETATATATAAAAETATATETATAAAAAAAAGRGNGDLLGTLPLLQHVQRIRGGGGASLPLCVTALPTHTLAEVLALLCAHRVHRVVVVHPVSKRALSVVSLTDVLRVLSEA